MVSIVLQYFDGCPNWIQADRRLHEARAQLGDTEGRVVHQRIETLDEAVAAGFTGSPTILIDGRDPFDVDGAQPGMACRVYPTPDGPRGSPTLEQLVFAPRPGTVNAPRATSEDQDGPA